MKPQNKKTAKAAELLFTALADLIMGVILILIDKAIK